jgi:hypothetical protein
MQKQQKTTIWQAKPREYPRFVLDLPLMVRTAMRIYGRTRDISETGMGATVPTELAFNELLELEFQFSDEPVPMSFIAEVSFRQGFHYGFKFVGPTARQRETIRRNTRTLHVVR